MGNSLKMIIRWSVAGSLLGLFLTGCAWVTLTPDGEKARVLSTSDVSSCTELGETHSSVQSTLWFYRRNSVKVKGELEALARNEAANLGGDTIVPTSDVKDGKQTFAVYRCMN